MLKRRKYFGRGFNARACLMLFFSFIISGIELNAQQIEQKTKVTGGIGLHWGAMTVKNGVYNRLYTPVPDNDPEVTYTDLMDLKTNASSIGLNLEVLGKRWLFDLDLNMPTKAKSSYFTKNTGYVLNIGVARGKTFKQTFGVFAGASFFANMSTIAPASGNFTNQPTATYSGPAIVPCLPRGNLSLEINGVIH